MPEKSKSMCAGCRDDFYNGNNPMGIQECWHFTSATVENRIIVGIHERPPYKRKPQACLSCFHPTGKAAVKPEALGADGYWKH